MSEARKSPIFDHSAELLSEAKKEIYKSIGDIELPLYVFRPEEQPVERQCPAVIFFFSSLWDKGRISQFAPQCNYLSKRGVVAIAADYRLTAQHGTTAIDAMSDARDAIRWLRLNAGALGVNPEWIVAAGGSGGAHLALSAAMIDDPAFILPGEDLTENHKPNALILFGPIIDPSPLQEATSAFPDLKTARLANAIRYVRSDIPPILIFHGTADRISPFAPVVDFSHRMERKKNACTLYAFDGAGSGFFNFNVDPESYEVALLAAEDFLVDLGYLEACESDEEIPTIEGRLGL